MKSKVIDGVEVRLCDQNGCEFPAFYTLTWTEHKYYCLIHANTAVKVAEAMGFPTPKRTLRMMTIDELVIDDSGDEQPTD